MSSEVSSDSAKAVRGSFRPILRWLYAPWAWFVLIPFFGVSTLIFGTLALVVSKTIGPRAGFRVGTAWAWVNSKVNLTRTEIINPDRIDPQQSYVIMSNHSSHYDIIAFYGAWRHQFRWVMRHSLRKVPGLGWGSEAVGHIFINRTNREAAIASLHEARERLVDGVSVMFFPEGTRSSDGRLMAFKKGGFMMALDLGIPILPISMSGPSDVLPYGHWKPLPGRIRITVHEPIDVAQYGLERRPELMHEVREAIRSGLNDWERGLDLPPPS